MANPPVPVDPAPTRASLRRQRRRVGLITDVAVIAAVALFVIGAAIIGLVQLHSGLTGR